LQSDIGKAINETRDKKFTGDVVPGDVLKLLGKDGFRIVTQLINNTDDTGEWPRDFTLVTVIALQKKPKLRYAVTTAQFSLISHTAKVLRRRIEKKIKDVVGEDQFGFRRGKGASDTDRMLRMISQQTLALDEELCACFIDWQTAFDHVNWTKLTQILK
jgi:hypothetical protein